MAVRHERLGRRRWRSTREGGREGDREWLRGGGRMADLGAITGGGSRDGQARGWWGEVIVMACRSAGVPQIPSADPTTSTPLEVNLHTPKEQPTHLWARGASLCTHRPSRRLRNGWWVHRVGCRAQREGGPPLGEKGWAVAGRAAGCPGRRRWCRGRGGPPPPTKCCWGGCGERGQAWVGARCGGWTVVAVHGGRTWGPSQVAGRGNGQAWGWCRGVIVVACRSVARNSREGVGRGAVGGSRWGRGGFGRGATGGVPEGRGGPPPPTNCCREDCGERG